MLALPPSLSDTKEHFCQHHQVSINSFYKYKKRQQSLTPDPSTRFVQFRKHRSRK